MGGLCCAQGRRWMAALNKKRGSQREEASNEDLAGLCTRCSARQAINAQRRLATCAAMRWPPQLARKAANEAEIGRHELGKVHAHVLSKLCPGSRNSLQRPAPPCDGPSNSGQPSCRSICPLGAAATRYVVASAFQVVFVFGSAGSGGSHFRAQRGP